MPILRVIVIWCGVALAFLFGVWVGASSDFPVYEPDAQQMLEQQIDEQAIQDMIDLLKILPQGELV